MAVPLAGERKRRMPVPSWRAEGSGAELGAGGWDVAGCGAVCAALWALRAPHCLQVRLGMNGDGRCSKTGSVVC